MTRRLLAGCLTAALFLAPVAGCEDSKSPPKLEGSAAEFKPQPQNATSRGGTNAAGGGAMFR